MAGDCYQANAKELMYDSKFKNAVLIHGIALLSSDKKPFGHCWIEKGNTVYDFSNGKNLKVSKKVYYALGHIPVDGYKNHKYKIKDVPFSTRMNKGTMASSNMIDYHYQSYGIIMDFLVIKLFYLA